MMDLKSVFNASSFNAYSFNEFQLQGISVRFWTCFTVLCLVLYHVRRKAILQYRADFEFGELNGCKPPTVVLQYDWPLGIDVVRKGFRYGRAKKLLALFTDFWENLGGTTMEVSLLGGTGYATKDPENIEAILSTQFEDFHLGPRSWGMRAMIGDGIFTQDGAPWKHSRDLLRKQFMRMKYQNLQGFREHVENMIQRIHKQSGIVDLQPLFYRMTLDTTIAMILGQPVETFEHEIGDHFSTAFNKASLVTATRVRLGDLFFLYAPPGYFGACKTIKQYTYQFVKDALQQERDGSSNFDFTFITDLQHEYQNLDLVRDQVLNILIAGRDTTASSMAYAIRLLVRNRSALEKVQREVREVLGEEKNVTREHIHRMPYLGKVIKETLRLYPPVPINSRFCKTTTTLPRGGGPDGKSPILIRAGMPVAYSVYHMQRSEEIYGPDAAEFRPERWDDLEITKNKWTYLPFNGGPRLCLGKDFGIMLASYGLARVIQTFPGISLAPGETIEASGTEQQHLTLTLANADGCKVVLA